MKNLWSKKPGKDQVGVLGSQENTRLIYPWDFPGKNTGAGGHALLQGIFPTQGRSPGLASGFFITSPAWGAPTLGLRNLGMTV